MKNVGFAILGCTSGAKYEYNGLFDKSLNLDWYADGDNVLGKELREDEWIILLERKQLNKKKLNVIRIFQYAKGYQNRPGWFGAGMITEGIPEFEESDLLYKLFEDYRVKVNSNNKILTDELFSSFKLKLPSNQVNSSLNLYDTFVDVSKDSRIIFNSGYDNIEKILSMIPVALIHPDYANYEKILFTSCDSLISRYKKENGIVVDKLKSLYNLKGFSKKIENDIIKLKEKAKEQRRQEEKAFQKTELELKEKEKEQIQRLENEFQKKELVNKEKEEQNKIEIQKANEQLSIISQKVNDINLEISRKNDEKNNLDTEIKNMNTSIHEINQEYELSIQRKEIIEEAESEFRKAVLGVMDSDNDFYELLFKHISEKEDILDRYNKHDLLDILINDEKFYPDVIDAVESEKTGFKRFFSSTIGLIIIILLSITFGFLGSKFFFNSSTQSIVNQKNSKVPKQSNKDINASTELEQINQGKNVDSASSEEQSDMEISHEQSVSEKSEEIESTESISRESEKENLKKEIN